MADVHDLFPPDSQDLLVLVTGEQNVFPTAPASAAITTTTVLLCCYVTIKLQIGTIYLNDMLKAKYGSN